MLPWESPPASGNLWLSYFLIQGGVFVFRVPRSHFFSLDFVQSALLSQKIVRKNSYSKELTASKAEQPPGKLPPGARKAAPLARDGQTPALPAPGAGQGATGPPCLLVAEGTFEEQGWGRGRDMDRRGHLPQVPSSPPFCPRSELWQDPWS